MSQTHNRLQFEITNALDVLRARREGMVVAQETGFSQADATKIAVVISELARNIVNYAEHGQITLEIQHRPDAKICIVIRADDNGPGIADLDAALAGGKSTSGGLGLGISGSQRMMDEFKIESNGSGTHIQAVKWLT